MNLCQVNVSFGYYKVFIDGPIRTWNLIGRISKDNADMKYQQIDVDVLKVEVYK